MKVLDEKGKLFGIINIIDLAVLLVLLVLVAGGIWFVTRDDSPNTVESQIYYVTIKCPEFSDDVVNAIHVGDRLYYANGFTEEEISEVRTEPARIDIVRDDGTIVVTTHPEKKDIYVTVKVNDTLDDPMIWIGQLHATVGKEIVLKTRNVEIPGEIIEVAEQE